MSRFKFRDEESGDRLQNLDTGCPSAGTPVCEEPASEDLLRIIVSLPPVYRCSATFTSTVERQSVFPPCLAAARRCGHFTSALRQGLILGSTTNEVRSAEPTKLFGADELRTVWDVNNFAESTRLYVQSRKPGLQGASRPNGSVLCQPGASPQDGDTRELLSPKGAVLINIVG